VERSPAGDGTDVFLTHYGVEEVIQGEPTGGQSQRTSGVSYWQARPKDPELEAEMLNRLMVYLGGSDKRSEVAASRGETPTASRARMVDRPDGRKGLIISEDYNSSWRLVGLALDGSNFVVEDQNRSEGLYLVEYRTLTDQDQDEGWLSSLAFWRDKPPETGTRYQVRLAGQGPETLVVVYSSDGQPDDSPGARKVLDSLAQVIR
jgi:outer membrane protein assembly factor BamC